MKRTILLILSLTLLLGHSAYSLRLKSGDIVKVIGIGKKQTIKRLGRHRWYKVSIKKKTGWVFGAYLRIEGAINQIIPAEQGLKKLLPNCEISFE